MKKTLVFLCLLFVSIAIYAVDLEPVSLSIGSGQENYYYPVVPSGGYTMTHSLYFANELYHPEIDYENMWIDRVSFYFEGGTDWITQDHWEIQLAESSLPEFTNPTVYGGRTVFDGLIDVPSQSGWYTIPLTSPFVYTNTRNLMVTVIKKRPNILYGHFLCTDTSIARSVKQYERYYRPDQQSSSFIYIDNCIPNIAFRFTEIPIIPLIELNTLKYDFGSVHINEPGDPNQMKIRNKGNGVLELGPDNFTFTGSGAAYFSIDDNVFPIALEEDEEMDIPLLFETDAVGKHTANMRILYINDDYQQEFNVTLEGAGVGDAIGILTLGNFEDYNWEASTPAPYGNYRKSIHEQYIVSPAEMIDMGYSAGYIHSVAFKVYDVNKAKPLKNYRIYIKPSYDERSTTTLEDILSYDLVYHRDSYMAHGGWNTHQLNEPVYWNGYSGFTIKVVSNMTAETSENVSTYYSDYDLPMMCYQHSDWNETETLYNGPSLYRRPDMRLIMPIDDITDMQAKLLDGPAFVTEQSQTYLKARVKNRSGSRKANYTVRLLDEYGNQISSVSGVPIQVMEEIDFDLPWTPTEPGQHSLYAEVVISGDEMPDNNISPVFDVIALSFGENSLQVGDDDLTNDRYDRPTPYGGFYAAFKEQYLILASELTQNGFHSGAIKSLSFFVEEATLAKEMNGFRIRLKHTEQTQLSSSFELDGFTSVYLGGAYKAHLGWNHHFFQNEFVWDGESNILVEVLTGPNNEFTVNQRVRYSITDFNSVLYYQTDNGSVNSISQGQTSHQRPNMRFTVEQSGLLDMAVISVSGELHPRIDMAYSYDVLVKNHSPEPLSNYSVRLYRDDSILIGSAQGLEIEPHAEMMYSFFWGPQNLGVHNLYGEVIYADDENLENNTSPIYEVFVRPQTSAVVQMGYDTIYNDYNRPPSPYGGGRSDYIEYYYLTPQEIMAMGGGPGLIHSLAFKVKELNECTELQNYTIQLTHEDPAAGIFEDEPQNFAEVYFNPHLSLKRGWNVHQFATPFFYNGVDALIVKVDALLMGNRDYASVYHSRTPDYQTLRFEDVGGGEVRSTSRYVEGFEERPNMQFIFEMEEMGSLSGYVREDGYPVANVLVELPGDTYFGYTNALGYYWIPFIPVGNHTLYATKHGYDTISFNITIYEDQHSTYDIDMYGTPLIGVSETYYDFGSIPVGSTRSHEFTVSNAGGGELNVSSIVFEGAESFVITEMPNLPQMLRGDESINFTMEYTPQEDIEEFGTVTILDSAGNRIRMVRATGADPENVITVRGMGCYELTVSEGDDVDRIPFDFYYNASYSQVMYTNEELMGYNGLIQGIKIYNDFRSNVPNSRVLLWAGHSSEDDMSEGFLTSDELTLLFDDYLDFPDGENVIEFAFDEPFAYDGSQNLVLAYKRPLDEWHSSADRFRGVYEGYAARSLMAQSDYVEYDADELPYYYDITPFQPMTTFTTVSSDKGYFTGYIRDVTGSPIEGAEIRIGDDVYTSRNDGKFRGYVSGGTYYPSISKEGFASLSEEVVINAGQITRQDFVLEEGSNNAFVWGSVVYGLDGSHFAGATVLFEGDITQSVITDEEGNFDVELSLYESYNYTISATGFAPITGVLETYEPEIHMGEFALWEIAHSPINVVAEIADGYAGVNVSWDDPTGDAGLRSNNRGAKAQMPEHGIVGYFVYRIPGAIRDDETGWELLTDEPIEETTLYDDAWQYLDEGNYRWAVKAVYAGLNISDAAISNLLEKSDSDGELVGIVIDAITGAAISGASVLINDEIPLITGNDGEYSTPLSPGWHYATITHPQYESAIEEAISIFPGETTEISTQLQPLPKVNVSGVILASDTGLGIAYASVNVSGFESLSILSDADGAFSFEAFMNQEYSYEISAHGYESVYGEINVLEVDIDLGSITLNELTYPPSEVIAVINDSYDGVDINWSSSVPGIDGMLDSMERSQLSKKQDLRGLLGYRVWRFHSGDEGAPENWQEITLEPTSETYYHDPHWPSLEEDTYLWAVKAVYSADLLSDAVFSNTLEKIDAPGTLVGNIFDANFEEPVSGVLIYVDEDHQTYSDDYGDFALSLPAGMYEAIFTHQYYSETSYGDIIIRPLEETYISVEMSELHKVLLSGQVIASDSGEGLEDAIITITGFADYELATDLDGGFEWEIYSNQSYNLTIEKDGYTPHHAELVVLDADIDLGEITLYEIAYQPSELIAEINDSYTAVNLSWNAPNMRALSGYEVYRFASDAEADELNWTLLTPEPIDETQFVDEAWLDLADGSFKWAVKAIYPAGVISDPIISNELIKLGSDGILAGFILDLEDGTPIAGATITIDGGTAAFTSEENGSFSIHLVPGPHTLTVSHTYYNNSSVQSFVILPGETTNLNISLESFPRVYLSGAVVGSDTGTGLEGVNISFTGYANLEYTTNERGNFNCYLYASNSYNYTFSKDGYVSHSGSIDMGTYHLDIGEIMLYEIAYQPSALTAEVNDSYTAVNLSWNAPNIRALSGYQVWRFADGSEADELSWTLLTPEPIDETEFVDEAWLDLADNSYKWAVKAVYPAGVISDPVFSNELIKSSSVGLLAGFILDLEDDSPIAGATITIDGGTAAFTSGEDGSFSIQLVPGPHVLVVSHTYYEDSELQSFVIIPGESTTLNISLDSLPRVYLSGTVIASDTGTGLEGVNISFTGFADFDYSTNESGNFSCYLYASNSYDYTFSKDGYVSQSGSIDMGTYNLDIGDITLYEIAHQPSALIAEINDSYTAVNLSWNAPNIRGLSGYQVWRFVDGSEADELSWTLLTPEPIDETEFVDEAWLELVDNNYKWAVKAIYPAGVISDPILSNALTKSNADGTLAGYILDIEDNSPIAGAIITIDNDISVVSAVDGSYILSLNPGPHVLSVSHTYYKDSDAQDFVILPIETTILNITLESLPRVNVSGTILASDTGAGLEGVNIAITGFANYETQTNAQGFFSIFGYANHSYDYVISKDGYESQSGSIEVGTTDLDLGAITLYEIAYQPSALTAEINDSYTAVNLSWNAPNIRGLSGYQVWRLNSGSEANELSWTLLTPQTISTTQFIDEDWLDLDDNNYKWAVKAIYPAGVISDPIFSDALTKSNADGTLAGYILDLEDNSPIAGAIITIDNDISVVSAADGSYTLSLNPGPHVIAVSHTYYKDSDAQSFVILPAETIILNITLESLPRVNVSGTILASDTGAELEGVNIAITGFANYETQTNAQGFFSIFGYANHSYDYVISKDGYESQSGSIEVGTTDLDLGAITLYEIAYQPSALTAEINDSYTAVNLSWNAPNIRGLSGYQVWRLISGSEANENNWTLLTPQTISTTQFTDEAWLDLADNNYKWAVKAIYPAGVISDPILSNALTKSNADGTLAGYILDIEDNSPIAGATITIDNDINVVSAVDGSYAVSLNPGPHVLSVSHTYYKDSDAQSFVILPAETTILNITLESLPRVNVSGTILASDTGVGLEGVNIAITGFANYKTQTDAQGFFSIFGYANHSYDYVISKDGYESQSGTIEVGTTDLNLGEITLYEIVYQPSTLVAETNDSYTAVNLSWNAPNIRGLSGYQIWRFKSGFDSSEASWILLTDDPISETQFTDEAWLALSDGGYKWAVKAIYPAGVISDPIFSNVLTKSNADGTLVGYILDIEDNSPIAGAIITIDNDINVVSAADGFYTLSLNPGPHVLSVSHTYYKDSDAQSFVILPAETTNLNISLESLPRVNVSGTILASDTGAGLEGVNIAITGFANYETQTNAQGFFSIFGYANHSYDYVITKDGYESQSGTIEVGTTDLNLGEITLYEIAYQPSALTAEINDSYTAVNLSWNAPNIRGLSGYQVWRLNSGSEANELSWTLLTPQTINTNQFTDEDWLELTDNNYKWAVKAVYPAGVISDPIFSDALTKSNADGTLAGYILDIEDNSPIADAVITIDNDINVVSAVDGSYTLSLNPGPHVLSVSHTYYKDSDAQGFVILPIETTNLNISLESLPRVNVSGTILASDTGAGLEGVSIAITGFANYETQTDAQGFFSIFGYANHSYDYMITKDGYESQSGTIEVGTTDLNLGEITLYEIAYQPSALTAEINDSYTAVNLSWNAPNIRGLSGYQVWRFKSGFDSNEASWTLLTDEPINETQFTDEAWLALSDGGYRWAVKAIYPAGVISDPILSNALTKSNADGTLAGYILDLEDGSPIADAVITIDNDISVVSAVDGSYTLSLNPGPHVLSVSHTYYKDSDAQDFVILPIETTNLNISLESLPRVNVSGTILASDTGAGLEGVNIAITGFANYETQTDAQGFFSIFGYANHSYDYMITKDGYESQSGTIEVGTIDLDLGDITLYEIAYQPSALVAEINDSYTAVNLSWNAPNIRGLSGYQVWRLNSDSEANELSWTLLTPQTISTTEFTDEEWLDLADNSYKWAVKAIYPAGVISDPIFSDALTKSNADGTLAGYILDIEDNSPIAGAIITIDNDINVVSAADGFYTLSLNPGPHVIAVSHIYYKDSDAQDFVILPIETTNLNISLESLPRVNVSGTILASDTGAGLEGVNIAITGFANYETQTDAQGFFSIFGYANHSYDYVITKNGYESQSGTIEVGTSDLNLGNITLYEIAYQPSALIAEINDSYTAVNLSWNAPNIRGLSGYQVWRLNSGSETNEASWTLLTPQTISTNQFIDEAWLDLADSSYKWAVKAIYPAGVISDPIFSNALTKSNADGTLAGYILDTEDNSPIAGATITVDGINTTTSAANGAYTLNLSPGPHTLTVSHTYYETSDTQSFVILPAEITNLNISLESLPRVNVSGTILASDTGAGLEGVNIAITGFANYETQTDAQGFFSIFGYANHSYDYVITKNGYESQSGTIEVGTSDLNLGNITLYEIAYQPSALIAEINDSYTAVNLSWNAPNIRGLGGYQVWRLNSDSETNEASWTLLTPQTISTTQFTDNDWLDLADNSYKWAVKAIYPAGVISDPIFSNALTKSNADGTLAGYILDTENNSPIAGATITIDGTNTTPSAANGAYTLNLSPGPHTLTVSHTYYETSDTQSFVILPAETTNLNISLESLPRVNVSGTILASDTGAGLADVNITLQGFANYEFSTDAQGNFSKLVYASHDYDYTYSKDGYESQSGTIAVGTTDLNLGNITLYEIAYQPSALTAEINDSYTAVNLSWNAPSDRALSGYQVWRMTSTAESDESSWTLLTPQTISTTEFTDEDWPELADNSYKWAVKAIYPAGVISDPIFSDALTKSNANGTLAGFILDIEDESPISGAIVNVDGSIITVSTNDGTYSLNLTPGPHTLTVSHTYYETSDTQSFVILPAETTSLNISLESLPRVTVNGTILASDTGAGLEGVNISVTGFANYETQTDADGNFSLYGFANQTYGYEISKLGYESQSGTLPVGNTDQNIGEITLYEIAYQPSALTAEINDSYSAVNLSWNAPDNRALSGYQVWRMTSTVEADESSWTLLTPEVITETQLTDADWLDLFDTSYKWAVKAIYPAGVISDPILSNELIKSNEPGVISGLVMDMEDESPIVGASISIDDEFFTYSLTDGTYSVNLTPGPHTITVSHTYYETSDTQSFVILPGETTNLNISLESLPRVYVSGTILASDTGAGLEGASIVISGFMEHELLTDEDGYFNVRAYANQEYSVTLSKPGYITLEGDVTLGDEDIDLGEFVLFEIAYQPENATAEINDDETAILISWDAPTPDHDTILSSFTLRDSPTESYRSQRAVLGYMVYRTLSEYIDDEDEWTPLTAAMITETQLEDTALNSLPNGDYVWAVKAIYNAGVISEPVFTNEITIHITHGVLSGYVYNQRDNQPIAGAILTIDDDIVVSSDESGFYSFSLVEGSYSLSVSHEDYSTVEIEDIIIIARETTNVDVYMEPTSNADLVNPISTKLLANYPNPFNPETTISFELKEASEVRIDIFNIKGQKVRSLTNQPYLAGTHSLVFRAYDDRGSKLSSGMYFYRMNADGYTKTRKMMLME